MARAYFVVRAVVADPADRTDFDQWYRDTHLADAVNAIHARRAWRGWSTLNPAVHIAFYEFESAESARAVGSSEPIKDLVAEFDRMWGTRVTRTRDVVEVAGEM